MQTTPTTHRLRPLWSMKNSSVRKRSLPFSSRPSGTRRVRRSTHLTRSTPFTIKNTPCDGNCRVQFRLMVPVTVSPDTYTGLSVRTKQLLPALKLAPMVKKNGGRLDLLC